MICLAPKRIEDWHPETSKTVTGYHSHVWLKCKDSNSGKLVLFIKYGAEIESMSRSYIRENQYGDNNTITLRGRHFERRSICSLRDDRGNTMEAPIVFFLDTSTVTCNISGLFQSIPVQAHISLKDYNPQNSSVVSESNRVPLMLLPLFIIWPAFDEATEMFYL